jgi:hypothetical protein
MKSSIFGTPYNTWSPEEILAYYQTRTGIYYFPVLDADQTAKEKIDGILMHRFDFNGECHQLPKHFVWTYNPSADLEWLILLHKFYYAPGLGVAYQETKDQRYVAKWIELTSSWIDTVPLGFLSSDVAGRRVQNWIFAHYYFITAAQTLCIPAAFYRKFLTSLCHQVNYLCDHLTPARNHRTLELSAIFLAAVVFPELKEADTWLQFSRKELVKNIQTALLNDGVHCELSTDYHHLVLKNYLGVRLLALLNGISMPKEMDILIQKALEFALYVHKPDGLIPALSDGDSRSFLDLLEQGYELYHDETMLYVASQGKRGTPPSSRSKAFPDSGYYILRSDWRDRAEPFEDARYLVFDCGPLGRGNHGHLDLLSFEMAAYGQSLIVDPGRYTYHESGETNWRVLFRSTGYHNTVQVDKKNQTRYVFHKTRFKIQGPEPAWELKQFLSDSGFDFLHGIARSHEYEVVHERKIFFCCPEYWIIADILQAQEMHDYDLLFHLSDQAYNQVSITVVQDTLQIDAPHLIIAQPFDPAMQAMVEEGYISRTYGVKHRAPVIRFARRAVSTAYYTILYPYKTVRPQIRVEVLPVLQGRHPCPKTQAVALCITLSKHGQPYQDYYFSADSADKTLYTFGDFTYTGTLLFVRRDATGRMVTLHREPCTELTTRSSLRGLRHDRSVYHP